MRQGVYVRGEVKAKAKAIIRTASNRRRDVV